MLSSQNPPGITAAAAPAAGRARSLSLAHFSLGLAGVMWVYSFLNYYHAYPITTFYQEWGTAVLGLAASILLLGKDYWRQAEVPRVVLLPIGIMMLVVVQFLMGDVDYFGQMLLYSQYMMWAALLIMLGGRLREVLGLPAVATVLAVFLLAGAELNALAGLYQHYQWHSFLDRVITVKNSAAIYGNIAQQNHFADYLVLGLTSLGLIYTRGLVRAWQAALLALPILFVLPLTGSREAWYFLVWLAVISLVWQWRSRDQRRLLYFSVLVLLGFGLMHLVIQLPWLQSSTGSVNTVQRMFAEDVHSGSIRLYLWREAGIMFGNSPLLGVGFGQFAWQHYQLAPQLQNTGIVGLYNNAHNLIMQLAAEGGLAGMLVLGGTLLLWLRQAYRAERSIYLWWGCALLSVIGIHSMLEYPLWYTYFLGIAALALGMFDTSRYRLELGLAGRALVLLTLVFGAMSLQQLFTGYRAYENLFAMRPDPRDPAPYFQSVNGILAEMQGMPLLRPYADLQTAMMVEITSENLDAKLKLEGDAVRFVPFGPVTYRLSMLLAQKGDLAGAQAEMERSIWSFPGDFAAEQDTLGKLASKDPDHFRALLEFAIQKYEEYQSAVRTK